MLKWSDAFVPVIILAFVAGAYVIGYGNGKLVTESNHAQANLTLTSQSLPKLDNANRTFDAILYELQQDKAADDCPVVTVIVRSIDLMPEPAGSRSR